MPNEGFTLKQHPRRTDSKRGTHVQAGHPRVRSSNLAAAISNAVDIGRQTAPAADETARLAAASTLAVDALAQALELHDYRRGAFAETRSRAERVTKLAARLAAQVAPELAADPRLAHGFRLHDIGMIGVSGSILSKQGPLTRAELDEIHEHPWLGERIVAPVPDLNGLARQVIGSHHEKWDGSGYPRRLRGEEIPLAARIFALADAFDAMTSPTGARCQSTSPRRKSPPRRVPTSTRSLRRGLSS